MMTPGSARRVSARAVAWPVLILSLALTLPLRRLAGRRRAIFEATPVEYVSSGRALRAASFGYDGLLADIYWTRVVQYFGRARLGGHTRLDLLGPMLRITTTLDPNLLVAYRFGAIFLAAKPPEGAGRPEEALALLRRGIVANPSHWRLWQDLGFISYWDLHDYASAARAFQAGSEQPGAAIWMKTIAAAVALKGGEVQTSRLLWTEIYRQAQNDSIRQNALAHLAAIEADQELTRLDALLAHYRKARGRSATSFGDLVRAGLLKSGPLDPSGIPYRIDAHGRAALAPQSAINLRLAR